MIEHTVRAFDADLRGLAGKIMQMGHLDENQIAEALQALAKRDAVLAKQIIEADDQVDALQRHVEETAVQTIARRQPMAVDLRQIVGALRIANDLERMGDLAENIAKRVLLLSETSPIKETMPQLEMMGKLVLAQLKKVLRSFEHLDVPAALEVWRKDAEIDALNNSFFRELLTYMMENPRNITLCTHLLFCAKNIERMGDHATNIAETVYYIVEGREISEERPKADVTSKMALPRLA
jgi:phosphate transport system protein